MVLSTTDINYLNTIPLGKIQTWENEKSASVMPVAFPGEDGDSTEAYDTLGMISYITIRGIYTGDFSTIMNNLRSIKTILDGNQISYSTIYSPFVNGKYAGDITRGNIGVSSPAGYGTAQLIDPLAHFTSWGIKAGDYVKNMTTNQVTQVNTVFSDTTLLLDDDIFTTIKIPYAITANIRVKVLAFQEQWGLPGLNFCQYSMQLVQVKL